jgi:pimeloyl-ACP methyl ester carboxylesterase
MSRTRRLYLLGALLLPLLSATAGMGDTVVLTNGNVYRGVVDRDRPLIWIFDGLKRVVVRDSKVARIDPDASFRSLEEFKIEQPLVVHGGSMPKEVLGVKAEPWNNKGRRLFQYLGGRSSKPVSMEQAINEMGPHSLRIRGVDGFWQGQLATNQVPRDVILAILAKVERDNENERLRVARFLIQAEWYKEAKAELEGLIRDFPSLRERAEGALASVLQLEAVQLRDEIEVRRHSQQPKAVLARLKAFPSREVSADLLGTIREQVRAEETQAAADNAMAVALGDSADRLSSPNQGIWRKPILEVVQNLTGAPDIVRERLAAWQKARVGASPGDESQFALAMSGYVVGADAAVTDLETALQYWKARDLVREYLGGRDPLARKLAIDKLQVLPTPDDPAQSDPIGLLELITRLSVNMPPPLHDEETDSGESRLHRVQDDENSAPTEYAALLPPEYHPLRSYPVVVALHSGGGPKSVISSWAAEAQRRGYIVIAPEYNLPGAARDYRYTTSEHAAVELSLRDAKRRYSIDDDRVFLVGSLVGGNMAWDYGLAHPDLFAGVAVVSGLPGKYVFQTIDHTDRLPLYVALGDLAPASNELVFGEMLKPLIAKTYDVTYVEYYRRGLEDLPEEVGPIFDWMDKRHREPNPRKFDAVTARDSDNRFNGVVIREFMPGRTTAPEAVDPFGKNLKPATLKVNISSLSNLIKVDQSGIKRLDVWLGPKLVDFRKKLELRINGKTYFKGVAKPGPESLLEDLRIRGDRRQIYWMKISAG